MDYSSLPNDPDHPIGSSPWQSSPQPTSRAFTASEASSAPSSPLAKHSPQRSDSPPRIGQDDSREEQRDGLGADEEGRSYVEEPPAQPSVNGSAQRSPDHAQTSPQMEQPTQTQQQQRQQSRQAHHQQRATPNRYHGATARQPQRQNLPQYKLQAKITSLERTGRKDPVLKFDVHVSLGGLRGSERRTDREADEPSKVPDHSIP